jgi:hypothetical protein
MIPHDLTRRVECMWGIMMLTFDMTFQAPHPYHRETLSYLKKKTAKEPVPSVRNGPHGLNSWHPPRQLYTCQQPMIPLPVPLSLSLSVWWDTFIANCRLVSEVLLWKMAGCLLCNLCLLCIWALTPTCPWHTHARTHSQGW